MNNLTYGNSTTTVFIAPTPGLIINCLFAVLYVLASVDWMVTATLGLTLNPKLPFITERLPPGFIKFAQVKKKRHIFQKRVRRIIAHQPKSFSFWCAVSYTCQSISVAVVSILGAGSIRYQSDSFFYNAILVFSTLFLSTSYLSGVSIWFSGQKLKRLEDGAVSTISQEHYFAREASFYTFARGSIPIGLIWLVTQIVLSQMEIIQLHNIIQLNFGLPIVGGAAILLFHGLRVSRFTSFVHKVHRSQLSSSDTPHNSAATEHGQKKFKKTYKELLIWITITAVHFSCSLTVAILLLKPSSFEWEVFKPVGETYLWVIMMPLMLISILEFRKQATNRLRVGRRRMWKRSLTPAKRNPKNKHRR